MGYEAEGGNEIGTCLFLELIILPSNVKHVILYSDTCDGQNKNSYVAAMFLTVMKQSKFLETIEHKFLTTGHSHMKCDVDHPLYYIQSRDRLNINIRQAAFTWLLSRLKLIRTGIKSENTL
nr:unnamed protein product [Callosobruchus chinensis]